MEGTDLRDLRVLYLWRNDEFRLNQGQRYLRQALKTLCHVDEYGMEYTHPILPTERKTFVTDLVVLEKTFKPDIIICNSMKNRVWHNAQKIKTPVAIIMDDPHGARSRLNWINDDKIPMTLFKYRAGWKWWEDRLFKGHRQRWLPHQCETTVFKERGLDREHDFCLIGRNHKSTYPLRYEIYKWLGYAMPREPHPTYKVLYKKRYKRSWGWTPKKLEKAGVIMGEEYAEAIARCKFFPTGCSVYNYAVTKLFEVMGTGTPLASDAPAGAEELGFVKDHNYIHITSDTFKEKLEYYVENYSEAQKIAVNARKLMETRHSSQIRAKELLGYLEELY